MTEAKIKEGRSSPLGATVYAGGTNFSVYSKHATGVELLLFDYVDDDRPASHERRAVGQLREQRRLAERRGRVFADRATVASAVRGRVRAAGRSASGAAHERS